MRNSTHEIILMGGLGNQLFQLFAGKSLELKTGEKVNFTTSQIEIFGNSHGMDISKYFNLDEYLSVTKPISIEKLRVLREINRISRKLKVADFNHYYFSDEVGYDSTIFELTTPKKILGYFQSWKYFDSLSDFGFLEIKKPMSNRFQALELEISKSECGAIHIRRGDYLKHRQTFGLLSAKYYEEAIEQLNLPDGSTVYVFSDSVETAESMCQAWENRYLFKFVNNLQSFESMMLMSKFPKIVIANSTFSYWAALLEGNKERVIAPSKWFKSGDDPEELIPPYWTTTLSRWE
jgi:Glycosyl transferase family 11